MTWPTRVLSGASVQSTVTIEGLEWDRYKIPDPARAGKSESAGRHQQRNGPARAVKEPKEAAKSRADDGIAQPTAAPDHLKRPAGNMYEVAVNEGGNMRGADSDRYNNDRQASKGLT